MTGPCLLWVSDTPKPRVAVTLASRAGLPRMGVPALGYPLAAPFSCFDAGSAKPGDRRQRHDVLILAEAEMDTSPLTICHVLFLVPVGTTWPTLQYETYNGPPPSPLHF